jgi:hypothetical protein
MKLYLVVLDAVLGSFIAGALLITFVIVGLLAVGGVIVFAYLLRASVRKGVDRWMERQEQDIWTETLSFVDAEKAKYQCQHRNDPLWWMDGDAKREALYQQGELYGQVIEEELPF